MSLRLDDVGVRYGGVDALRDVSLLVEPGRVLGLIGPNGAGKTTLVNATTGLAPLASGTISLDGRRIDGLATHEIARRGIGRTFQAVKIFRDLPVRENLAIAAPSRRRPPAKRSSSASASPSAARAGHQTMLSKSGANAAAASEVKTANRDSVP